MKSERRHELEKNALADWMAVKVEAIKPYQNAIFGGLLLLIIVVGFWRWSSWRTQSNLESAWDRFDELSSQARPKPADFLGLAKAHAGTELDRRCSVLVGDILWESGGNLRFTDRQEADKELNKAIKQYEKVRAATAGDSQHRMLHAQATYGLACAQETLGELGKAIELYESLSKTSGRTYSAAAEYRLQDLRTGSTKEMYNRLAQYNPKPTPAADPLDFDPNSIGPGESLFPFDPLRNDGTDSSGGGTTDGTSGIMGDSPLGSILDDPLLGDGPDDATPSDGGTSPIEPGAALTPPGPPQLGVPADDVTTPPEGTTEAPAAE